MRIFTFTENTKGKQASTVISLTGMFIWLQKCNVTNNKIGNKEH